MHAEQLAGWLEQQLPRIIDLDPKNITVRHVFNWGGFVNQSFTVADGSVRYHLKLTDESGIVTKLRAWSRIHHILEQQYHAPRLIQWIDLPEIGFCGLLQEHVDGKPANFRADPALVDQVIALMDRLHNDAALRSHLEAAEPAKTCFDHFVETYIERFTADLEIVNRSRPSFISPDLLGWMHDETLRLREAANRGLTFHEPAAQPVHADLHEGNVLNGLNDWFVVDWDDLALGDPAQDFAVLLWPMIYEGRSWRDFNIPDAHEGFRERIEVCLRAQLLDEVVDTLADYADAGRVPSKQAEVQFIKRSRHEEALQKYSALWR